MNLWVPLLLLAAAPPAAPADAHDAVYAASGEDFVGQARRDAAALRQYDAGLTRLERQLAEHPELFSLPATATHTPDQKRLLLTAWGSFFEYVLTSELLRQRYWDFVKEPPTSERHGVGFVLTHAALTSELAHGLALANLAGKCPQVETLLDEPSAELGIPPRAYAELKYKVIHVATTTQLVTGDAYRDHVLPHLKQAALLTEPDFQALTEQTAANSKAARARLAQRGVSLFAGNALDIFKDNASTGLLPYQTSIAEWLSHTRVRRQGKPLIQREQAMALLEKMQPGDILVARQNWFLSNIGLPGFWPHAELYLSSPAQFASYFDADPEVRKWVASLPGGQPTLSGYLSTRFPEKWKAYNGLDFRGEPVRVMEAISEGVSFTGVGHAMLTDYLGVMRPRLSKVEKARAMVRAFEYQGRPYDFEFDFFSDAALVCSELVYKSYAPAAGTRGLTLPLVNIAGRMTLPPTEFVKLFDAQFGKADRQLDFVGFLDGREDLGRAVVADAEAFRQSYRRPKWDILQK